MNNQFKIDMRPLLKGIKGYSEISLSAAKEGMAKAGMQLLNDCIIQIPTVPLKEGTLRGSGSVFMQNKLVGISPKKFGKGNPSPDDHAKLKENTIITVVGFNTPYARRHHEVPAKFIEPGSGNKYIQAKLERNAQEYFILVAQIIKTKVDLKK